MRTNYKISLFTLVLLVVAGCNNVLEEKPRTAFTASYFTTAQGLQDGINAAYTGMRFHYGSNGAIGTFAPGTDEWTYGDQPRLQSSGDNLPHRELGTYAITTTNNFINTPFNRTFPFINTCNAVLEYLPQVGTLTELQRQTILGEASYLRAHYYMLLVSQFGPVPLDLGTGELKFNTVPYLGFKRLTPDLLKKNYQAIIDDLTVAVANLPDKRPVGAFKLSKAAALHLLAKMYLFRAYSDVTDNANADFESSYQTAMELINNKALYGVELQANFSEVFRQGNDYNSEVMFAIERIPRDFLNNMYNDLNVTGLGELENIQMANHNPEYTASIVTISGVAPFNGRPLVYGRPLRKIAPTQWLLMEAFAEKTNDSRYDGTFRTMWRAASLAAPGTAGHTALTNALAAVGAAIGDTALYLTKTDAAEAAAVARSVKYTVFGPSKWYTNQNFTRNIYPALSKFDDSNRADGNSASGRPIPVSRFAETYLLAAEAALRTNRPTEAVTLVNVLKKRAAFRPTLTPTEVDARYNLIALTSVADMDALATRGGDRFDFILDERSRELCGENLRWPDLALRGDDIFLRRVKFNPDAQGVQAFHRLRPIPQGQLDNFVPDAGTTKEDYQNEGY
jgi:hypothetical protein